VENYLFNRLLAVRLSDTLSLTIEAAVFGIVHARSVKIRAPPVNR